MKFDSWKATFCLGKFRIFFGILLWKGTFFCGNGHPFEEHPVEEIATFLGKWTSCRGNGHLFFLGTFDILEWKLTSFDFEAFSV